MNVTAGQIPKFQSKITYYLRTTWQRFSGENNWKEAVL